MEGYTWTRWVAVTVMMTIIAQDHMFVSGKSTVHFIGVNYGFLGDNLPPPRDAVNFILSKPNIKLVRIFEPNTEVIDALTGTGIGVSIGVKHTDLAAIASNQQAADDWINTYIIPHVYDVAFCWITVGNEAIPGPYAQYILPAIKNLYKTLDNAELSSPFFHVTTTVSSAVLGASYPPSAGVFSEETSGIMNELVKYLYTRGAPLMINVYPYFALASDPQHISLDYALFKSTSPVVMDGSLAYYNLYDAMVDAFVSAMEKVLGGAQDFDIVISETGWPSAGGNFATIENAATYNNNLRNHCREGTPKRPGVQLDTFIFALFNENQKPAGVEQNFGSFYPDKSPVYPLW